VRSAVCSEESYSAGTATPVDFVSQIIQFKDIRYARNG